MAIIMVPDLLRQFGNVHATQAAVTESAGIVHEAATVAAASAIVGPIGAEFLATFATAQANYARAVAQLAAVHDATAVTAHAAATSYEVTEGDSAADFLL